MLKEIDPDLSISAIGKLEKSVHHFVAPTGENFNKFQPTKEFGRKWFRPPTPDLGLASSCTFTFE